MASTEVSAPLAAIAILVMLALAPSRSPYCADIKLSAELERAAAAAAKAPSGPDKRAAYRELAALRELAGDTALAAAAWSEAAFASSGERDDDALLEAARCLLATGDFDRAHADVRTVLLTGRDPVLLKRALLLGARISLLRGEDGAAGRLQSLVDNPENSAERPANLLLLRLFTGDESFGRMLLADHPGSPEALILSSQPTPSVSLAATPFWLLRSGLELPINAPSQSLPDFAEAPPEPVSPVSASEADEGRGKGYLQIGLFSIEANAKVLMDRLSAKGFAAEKIQKKMAGKVVWVVAVDPGSSGYETSMRLKDAGFESFPVHE